MAEQRLTQNQLDQVIAEVQRISFKQEDELESEQVREILRELHLPPELLEDALVQVSRREALAVQQNSRRWLIGGAIAAIALITIGFTVLNQQQNQTLSRVGSNQSRLTLSQDRGDSLKFVLRQTNPELSYRVTLSDAPVGQKLSLSCSWLAPNGEIMHQNRYETKVITTASWNTTCRYAITTNAALGIWTVKTFLGDRILSEATFDVR